MAIKRIVDCKKQIDIPPKRHSWVVVMELKKRLFLKVIYSVAGERGLYFLSRDKREDLFIPYLHERIIEVVRDEDKIEELQKKYFKKQ